VGKNGPSRRDGGGLSGRLDQVIGAESVPGEALWFCRKMRLRGAEVEIGIYLGLTLDSHWAFQAHHERQAPSVEATANALGRLLRRKGGSGVEVRLQYAGVVRAKLLYRAPIWARELIDKRRSLQLVRRLHRTVVIRIGRGFRTISAAAVLAGFPLRTVGTEILRDLSP
jgi:hypothetical protein